MSQIRSAQHIDIFSQNASNHEDPVPEPAHKKSRPATSSGSMREVLALLALAAETGRSEMHNDQGQEQVDLESLRRDVEERYAQQLKRKEAEQQCQSSLRCLNRAICLPSLCDAVRAHCLHRNKNIFLVDEFATLMTMTCTLTSLRLLNEPSIDLIEHLSVTVPEFISLVPPDDLIDQPFVRVNIDTPYNTLRQKLMRQRGEAEMQKRALLAGITLRP
jgi:hypothetical protein